MEGKMETKICTKCGEEFPATPEYFSRHPNCAEGLYPRCKVCKYEEKKEWEKNNPEKYKASKKRYKERYKERYPEKHKAASKRKKKNYFTNNPDAKKLTHIRKSAKKRNIDFKLTLTEYREIFWGKPCHYCGVEMEATGLDRKYSGKNVGYTIDNVVPCCHACNSLKGVLPYDIFVNVVSELSSRGTLFEVLALTNVTNKKTIDIERQDGYAYVNQ
jgi:hypothetical protein